MYCIDSPIAPLCYANVCREFYFVRIIAVVADVGMQAASLWAGGFVPLFLAMLLHIILGGVSGQLIRAVCRVRQSGYLTPAL